MLSPEIVKASELESQAERARLSVEQMDEAVQSELDTIHEAVANLRVLLYVRGLKATDTYVDMAKESAFTKEETHILPRVRMDKRHGTPSFYWERVIRHTHVGAQKRSAKTRQYTAWVSRKGSRTKQKALVSLMSEHIPINKRTQQTSASHFSKEPTWAQSAFAWVEHELVPLRRQSNLLSSLHRLCLALRRS